MEVIRIGELNLTANFPQILSRHRAFNCPLRSHVHKHGRLRGAMGTGQLPASGAAFGFQQRKQRRILLVLQNEHGLLEKMSGARALPLHRLLIYNSKLFSESQYENKASTRFLMLNALALCYQSVPVRLFYVPGR